MRVDLCGVQDLTTLMEVEAGRVPDGVKVFYPRPPQDLGAVWMRSVFAMTGIVLVILACGEQRWWHLLVGLCAVAICWLITSGEAPEVGGRREVLLISSEGIVVRNGQGVQRWGWDDLNGIQVAPVDGQWCLITQNNRGYAEIVANGNYHGNLGEIHNLVRRQIREEAPQGAPLSLPPAPSIPPVA